MRYEVEDLKLFIRALERGEDVSILMDHMVILGVTKTLDYERLSQSRIWKTCLMPLKAHHIKKLSAIIWMNPQRDVFSIWK